MKCEKCGSNMNNFIKGSSQITECPNCGWSFATTFIDPIHEDSTVYSIIIEQGNEINAKSIMEVKKFTKLANPEIINILLNGNFVLTKQKATEIKDTMDILNKLKIKFRIDPEFKW